MYRVQLKNRHRRANESLTELADDVRILGQSMGRHVSLESRDKMARDYFTDALDSSDTRMRLL